MEKSSPAELLTWAEIDLEAIAHNLRAVKRHVGPQIGVMAVVKANAYGLQAGSEGPVPHLLCSRAQL